jgi:hypothetical protein
VSIVSWPDFEYSRMKVPSLSRGCEIAQFFVRHTEIRTHATSHG